MHAERGGGRTQSLRLRGGADDRGTSSESEVCGTSDSDSRVSEEAFSAAEAEPLPTPACDTGTPSSATRSAVLFWNSRKLGAAACEWRDRESHPREAAGLDKHALSRRKLIWLAELLATSQPVCVFVAEVEGSVSSLRLLRTWFRRFGYRMRWLLDDTGEGDSAEGKVVHLNVMVMAVRSGEASVLQSRRLAPRTWGVEVQLSATLQRFAAVGCHGMHAPRAGLHGQQRQTFRTQLEAAHDWLGPLGGGLLCGDLNRVPCSRWRSSGAALTADDRALRELTGWVCTCCERGRQRRVALGMFVGDQLDQNGAPRWTRQHGVQRARIDVGVAFGPNREMWSRGGEVASQWFAADGRGTMLSDHVAVEFLLRLRETSQGGAERRPMPLPFRGVRATAKAAAAQATYRATVGARAARELRWLRAQARHAGGSAVAPLVERLRSVGERAVELESEREEQRQDAVALRTAGASPRAEYRSWMRRLRRALSHRAASIDPRTISSGILFHECTGLARIRDNASLSGAEVWERVIHRCRRCVRRARSRMAKASPSTDRQLVVACAEMTRDPVDAASRIQTVWRLLTAKRSNVALSAVHPRDDTSQPVIGKHEEPFLRACGEVGAQVVAKLDEGGCVAAYEAWFKRFRIEFEKLRGLDGQEFSLPKALPFSVFRETLRGARGKAVGAGGLSIEMIVEAGPDVQLEVYNALMDDVESGVLSLQWKRVLYVLLVKPPPNNPACISGRREIALMPQEMKLLLKMIRSAVYKRVAPRIGAEQWGWCEGVGCVDPGLALQAVIQQTRRHRGRLYALWMDLATFFPKINRDIDEVGQLLHGLPAEVVQMTRMIYGARSGGVEHATRCQYDTDVGLSSVFYNHVGALMGCPLSTDRAKLLLNSALVAIAAHVKGVRLWGTDGRVDWARLCSLAYADDWAGVFESVEELRKAWSIWVAWEQITGCKLGVKALVKTVCSGVDFASGAAVAVDDPQLALATGELVPFIMPNAAYKHLGNLRRLDGDDRTAWKGDGVWGLGVRGKLEVALQRLKKVRPGAMTRDEFVMVSNALLGGIGGFYLQTLYITFAQAEEVEAKWRRIFNRLFSRDSSTPRAELYEAGPSGAVVRVHLWGVGLAAVHSAVEKAMTDVHNTAAREAARSLIASAMWRWGCRSDPQQWEWLHLREALESELRRSQSRHLGDAWMLAAVLLEAETAVDSEEHNLERERVRRFGRWQEAAPGALGPALSANAAHFAAPRSQLLFEPAGRGGVGAPVNARLLEVGVVAIGQMCKDGATGPEWMSFEDARGALADSDLRAADERHWSVVLEWLQQHAQPVGQERIVSCRQLPREPEASNGTEEGREHLLAEAARVRQLPRDQQGSVEEWEARLEEAFPGAFEPPGVWRTGTFDADAAARGARIGLLLEGDGRAVWQGGEARFCARGPGDDVLSLGEDALFSGWQQRALFWRDAIGFAADGWPTRDGRELTYADLATLPPAMQLECRARMRMTDLAKDNEVWTVERGGGVKRDFTHVALDVQRENHALLARLQAQCRFTHAYTSDASMAVARDHDGAALRAPNGVALKATSLAAARHDGEVVAGHFLEPEGSDNYLGELAALLAALDDAPEGSRVLLMFDATSPVRAWLRFRRKHARIRCGYKAFHLLDTLDQLVARHEMVVFLWQTSHVGSPTNEWADLEAERAMRGGEISAGSRLEVPRLTSQCFSVRSSRPTSSMFRWASERGQRAVVRRLRAASTQTVFFDAANDVAWRFGTERAARSVDAAADRAGRAVRAQRWTIRDSRRRWPAALQARVDSTTCIFGCACAGTWSHYQFFCPATELSDLRESWLDSVLDARQFIRPRDKGALPDHPLSKVLRILQRKELAGRTDFGPDCMELAEAARRVTGGLIRGCDDPRENARREVRMAAGSVAEAGLRLQVVAGLAERQAERELAERGLELRLLARCFSSLCEVMARRGPARVAAFRRVREATVDALGILRLITLEEAWSPEAILDAAVAVRAVVRELQLEADAVAAAGAAAPALWRLERWRLGWRVRHALSNGTEIVTDGMAADGMVARLLRASGARHVALVTHRVAARSRWVPLAAAIHDAVPVARLAGASELLQRAARAYIRSGWRRALYAHGKRGRVEAAERRREAVERGEAVDGAGRWRIADVLDARPTATGGVTMLVSWLSGDAASWEPLRGGTQWARAKAHHIVAARRGARRVARAAVATVVAQARAAAQALHPPRATPRVAGATPVPGLDSGGRRQRGDGDGSAQRRVAARRAAAVAVEPSAGRRRDGAQAGMMPASERRDDGVETGRRRARRGDEAVEQEAARAARATRRAAAQTAAAAAMEVPMAERRRTGAQSAEPLAGRRRSGAQAGMMPVAERRDSGDATGHRRARRDVGTAEQEEAGAAGATRCAAASAAAMAANEEPMAGRRRTGAQAGMPPAEARHEDGGPGANRRARRGDAERPLVDGARAARARQREAAREREEARAAADDGVAPSTEAGRRRSAVAAGVGSADAARAADDPSGTRRLRSAAGAGSKRGRVAAGVAVVGTARSGAEAAATRRANARVERCRRRSLDEADAARCDETGGNP